MKVLKLNKGADRRLRSGHLWVYSNEVDNHHTPLKGFDAGEQVVVEDAGGRSMGVAMVNPHHLICARLVSRDPAQQLDRHLLEVRIRQAMQWRDRCYPEPYYRMVYGDSDGLPGLVIDRYGDIDVVQCNSAGMAVLHSEILDALQAVHSPRGVLFRNDSLARDAEGLTEEVLVEGDVPAWVELQENGVVLEAPLREGQKTGWFYDHRENRAFLQRLCRGCSVLDVFCYAGGWGVQALAAGAASLVAVDSSATAVEAVRRNAARQPVNVMPDIHQGQADEVLKELVRQGRTFDVVILDPPAFIKRRKDHDAGTKAYHQYNRLALKLLSPGGLLVSASCSMSLSLAELTGIVGSAARSGGRQLQVVHCGGQAPDHPVHPMIPETAYLKALFARELTA